MAQGSSDGFEEPPKSLHLVLAGLIPLIQLFLMVYSFWYLFCPFGHGQCGDRLNDKFNSSPGGAHVGHFVVFSQCLQLLLMCDYLYYYIKAMYSGKDITAELSQTWANPRGSAENFV